MTDCKWPVCGSRSNPEPAGVMPMRTTTHADERAVMTRLHLSPTYAVGIDFEVVSEAITTRSRGSSHEPTSTVSTPPRRSRTSP